MFNYFGKEEYTKQKKFAQMRDNYLKFIIVPLAKTGVKPDYITILSVISLLIGLIILPYNKFLSGFLILMYCLLDGIDGGLARYLNIQSKRGSLLDIFADQVGILVMPVFSIIYFNANPVYAYLFGMGYILYIVFLVILNSLKQPVSFVLRVKYFYYGILWLNSFLNYPLVNMFQLIFGLFYSILSIWLFWKLLDFYKNKL